MRDATFCPVCQSPAYLCLYRHVTEAATTEGYRRHLLAHVLACDRVETEMRLCRDCALLYLSPRFTADELARLYTPSYFTERPLVDPGWVDPAAREGARIAASEAARRTMIAALLAPHAGPLRKILDMGGGKGSLIPDLPGREAAFVCDTGVTETEPHVIRLDVPEAEAPYDLVMCTHVLEHLDDPRGFLSRLAGLTLPGGIVYVEVPYEGPPALYRKQGLGEHLNFFTRTALRRLAADCGLRVLSLQERRYDYALWETNALCAVLRRAPAVQRSAPMWRAFPAEIGAVAARRIAAMAGR